MANLTEKQMVSRLIELKGNITVFGTKQKDAREALEQCKYDMKKAGFTSIKKVEAEIQRIQKMITKKEQRFVTLENELVTVIDEFEERL